MLFNSILYFLHNLLHDVNNKHIIFNKCLLWICWAVSHMLFYLLSEFPQTSAHREFKWHPIKSKNLDFSNFYPQEPLLAWKISLSSIWESVGVNLCVFTYLTILAENHCSHKQWIYLGNCYLFPVTTGYPITLPDIQRGLSLC